MENAQRRVHIKETTHRGELHKVECIHGEVYKTECTHGRMYIEWSVHMERCTLD